MRFIDAHTHAWGHDTEELPWTEKVLPPEWEGPYPHDALISDMDHLGIDASVIVTTPMYGRGERANEYTMRCIEAHPTRFYGVGFIDFMQDESDQRAAVRRVVGHDSMQGIRMYAPFEYAEIPTELNPTADWILDRSIDPVWDELAQQDACMFIFPRSEQLEMIDELAERHPNVQIVIDHMAWPNEQTDPEESPWTDFHEIADHQNTYVKVSSLPRSSQEEWPYQDLHGYVRNLVDWFGPERLMIGSDYPWMDKWASYGECLSWVEETEFLSALDVSYLTHRTFEKLHT